MYWLDRYGYLEKLKDKNRFGLFLDMGIGKTSLMLSLLDYHYLISKMLKKFY